MYFVKPLIIEVIAQLWNQEQQNPLDHDPDVSFWKSMQGFSWNIKKMLEKLFDFGVQWSKLVSCTFKM